MSLRDKSTDILKAEFRINEIFYSLQGEGTRAGLPCVFIRLQGCKLRCSWCDTKFAQKFDDTADIMSGARILEEVKKHECSFVALTGGEPMDHDNVIPLLSLLCDNFETVELETNGSVDLYEVDKRV
ncbi:MAG: radical SAM protein, partial [Chlorobi bacterium]|nr:radical SAM protein [Chlorobiota bacterium]